MTIPIPFAPKLDHSIYLISLKAHRQSDRNVLPLNCVCVCECATLLMHGIVKFGPRQFIILLTAKLRYPKTASTLEGRKSMLEKKEKIGLEQMF